MPAVIRPSTCDDRPAIRSIFGEGKFALLELWLEYPLLGEHLAARARG